MAEEQTYYNAVAFISDIHANLEALEAVLEDIEEQNVSGIYCLGDIVGYGADPLACLRTLLELQESGKLLQTVCGNHDYGVVHNDYTLFNSSARLSNIWTRDKIKDTPEYSLLEKIAGEKLVKEAGKFTLVHSTLNPEPVKWDYLKTKNAGENFVHRRIVYVGHSHVPALYSRYSSGKEWNPITLFENSGFYFLPPSKRENLSPGQATSHYRLVLPDTFPTMLVNVGSVGQPRDNNPWARYVLYQTVDFTSYIEYRQVGYDIEKTVHKLKERGLECDEKLAIRLATGGPSSFDPLSPPPKWFPYPTSTTT